MQMVFSAITKARIACLDSQDFQITALVVFASQLLVMKMSVIQKSDVIFGVGGNHFWTVLRIILVCYIYSSQ